MRSNELGLVNVDHGNDEEEDNTQMENAGIANNPDATLVNNNNNNNNPNNGVIELDIANACANVDISVEEDIDICWPHSKRTNAGIAWH